MTATPTEAISATVIGAPARRSAYSGTRRLLLGLLILAPAALFGFSLVWPIATVVIRSLNAEGALELSDLTFDHYIGVFQDQVLLRVTLQTFGLAALSTVIVVVLAFPVAYLMSRVRPRLGFILLVLIMVPFWVSILIRLFAFTAILGRRGVVNAALGSVGLGPYDLLFNSPAVVIGMVAYLLPYMILILYACMVGIDPNLMTVARTMGASARQAFVQVYLPQVRSALVSGGLLVFVLGLGFFLTPAILGGPRDLTIPVFMEQEIGVYRWGPASAAGIVLLIVSLVGYLLALRIGGSSVLAPSGRPSSRGATEREPLRFGVGSVLSWVATVIVLIVLLAPLLVIIPAAFGETSQIAFPPQGFTLEWFVEIFTERSWTDPLAKSVRVGLGTAVLATAIGLILARLNAQLRPAWARTLIQSVAFAPLVIPVILLAIGVFDVQVRTGLIGTDLGLVLAHAAICVPFAFLIITNSMAHLDASLEEAAWSMGVGRVRAFWTIVIPGIVPGLIGAFVISFMTSWDEAVIALFQTGLADTLPVTIYSLIRSGVTPAVAAVSVFLIAIVLVGGAVYLVITARNSQRKESR